MATLRNAEEKATTTRTLTTASENHVNLIRTNHKKAHVSIRRALSLDEAGATRQASHLYSEGLLYLAKGLSIECSGVGPEWASARQMQSQMQRTARQMKTRLEELERKPGREENGVDAAGSSLLDVQQIQELQDDLRLEAELMDYAEPTPPSYQQSQTDAVEVFGIPDGVQIFFIDSRGHVSAPSHPSALRIYKFRDGELVDLADQPPAFLQVGDWLYPLVAGESPALKTRQGAFIFPDVVSGEEGACVGVMFSPAIDRSTIRSFARAIEELTVLRHQREAPPRPPPPAVAGRSDGDSEKTEEDEDTGDQLSTQIAKGIVVGAEWISWGLGKGAEATCYLINAGKEKLKENLRTDETPAKIDGKYQKGAEYAQTASVVAVKVSRVVVDSLCYMTKRLAQEVSPYVKRQSDKLLKSDGDQPDSNMSKNVDAFVEIAASGLEGVGTIYVGLERASRVLAQNISNATVDVIQHKYGSDAGRLTDTSLDAATNIGFTAYNLSSVGVKAVAKRATKETGKAVLEDYKTEMSKEKGPGRTAKENGK